MMEKHDWSRKYVNKQVSRIRAMFKFGVGREMVLADCWQALKAVEPLLVGKTKAREIAPVTTIDDEYIEAVIPFLSRRIVAMVRFQQLTGCRAGELVVMKWTHIQTANPGLWEYRPTRHKGTHRGHDRIIYINTEAQSIIEPFRTANLAGYVFCPQLAEEERRVRLSLSRKTKLTAGNSPGTNRTRRPRRTPGDCYDVDSYRRAITRACDPDSGLISVKLHVNAPETAAVQK